MIAWEPVATSGARQTNYPKRLRIVFHTNVFISWQPLRAPLYNKELLYVCTLPIVTGVCFSFSYGCQLYSKYCQEQSRSSRPG